MKRLISILFLLITAIVSFAQTEEQIKIQLFLGNWESKFEETIITERWSAVSDSEYTAKVFEITKTDTIITETIRLFIKDGKLYYCPSVKEQNNSEEIQFELVNLENFGTKFTFENKNHDFPQRIIYDFESDLKLNTAIEGKIDDKFRHTDFSYIKIINPVDSYILTGTLRKQNFINQGGRKIENVYDYFFEIRGVKYFIKFRESGITIKELEGYIDKPLKLNFMIFHGLWDTDDPNHQSRIGSYIVISSIAE